MSLRFFANTTTAIGNVLTTNYSRVQLGNFAVDTNQITLSAWVNVIDWGPTGSDPRIILKQNVASTYSAGQDRFQWFLGLNRESTADRPKTLRARFNYSATTILGNTPLINNKWHHAVAVYNGGTASLYLDGNLEITSSAFNSTPLTADTGLEYPVMLGNNGANTSGAIQPNAFNGHIAHPTIWNSALTADEILSLSLGLTSIKVKPANIVSYLGTKNIDIFRDPTIQAFNVVDGQIEPRIILGSRKQLKIKGRNRFVGVIVSPTVSVTAISSSSIQVSVTAEPTQGSVITSYLIQRSTAQDFTSNLEQFSTPNFEDFSLNPLTTYYYRARFTQSDGRISDWSETKFESTPDIDDPETGDLDLAAPTMTAISEFYESTDVTPITPIQLPTVTLSNATQNSINVNVAAVPVTGQTITSYLIQRTTTPNVADSWQQVFTGVNSSFTNTDLNPSTLYHYRARFTQSDGRISDFSQSKSLATTQLIAPPSPPSTLVFPRVAIIMNGSRHKYDTASWQQSAARYDLALWGLWETWGNDGRLMSFTQACANLKALNPNVVLLVYHNPEASSSLDGGVRPVYRNTINAQNWWLRTSFPSGPIVTVNAYGDVFSIPNTFPGGPTLNGQSYIQWVMSTYVRDVYVNGVYPQNTPANPYIDGFFFDNIFMMYAKTGDWTRDGVSDAQNNLALGELYRQGIAQGVAAYRALLPGKPFAGNNTLGTLYYNPWGLPAPPPEYAGLFDYGMVEFYTGESFSADEWGNPTIMLQGARNHALQQTKPENQIMYSTRRYTLTSTNFQDARYAITAMLCASDGYISYKDATGDTGTMETGYEAAGKWFDEFDNAGTQKYYLGTAIDPIVTTSWTQGVYRRRFQNGWVLWNPKGNGVRTVSLGQLMKKIQGRVGDSDTTVNNGATVTSVTLQDRDGIILLNADVLVTIPSPPSALSTLATSTTQITLSWTDNSNNEVGFKIERSTNGVNFSQIATVAANITSYTDNNLSASTTCTYRVRSYNSAGDSTSTNTSSATTQAIPISSNWFPDWPTMRVTSAYGMYPETLTGPHTAFNIETYSRYDVVSGATQTYQPNLTSLNEMYDVYKSVKDKRALVGKPFSPKLLPYIAIEVYKPGIFGDTRQGEDTSTGKVNQLVRGTQFSDSYVRQYVDVGSGNPQWWARMPGTANSLGQQVESAFNPLTLWRANPATHLLPKNNKNESLAEAFARVMKEFDSIPLTVGRTKLIDLIDGYFFDVVSFTPENHTINNGATRVQVDYDQDGVADSNNNHTVNNLNYFAEGGAIKEQRGFVFYRDAFKQKMPNFMFAVNNVGWSLSLWNNLNIPAGAAANSPQLGQFEHSMSEHSNWYFGFGKSASPPNPYEVNGFADFKAGNYILALHDATLTSDANSVAGRSYVQSILFESLTDNDADYRRAREMYRFLFGAAMLHPRVAIGLMTGRGRHFDIDDLHWYLGNPKRNRSMGTLNLNVQLHYNNVNNAWQMRAPNATNGSAQFWWEEFDNGIVVVRGDYTGYSTGEKYYDYSNPGEVGVTAVSCPLPNPGTGYKWAFIPTSFTNLNTGLQSRNLDPTINTGADCTGGTYGQVPMYPATARVLRRVLI